MSRILIGNVRDKLVNNLQATKAGTGALDALQGKVLKDLVESVLGQQADVYSSEKTYAVGDYCIHENTLHKCSAAISVAEEWTAGHWAQTTIADELKSIVGSVAAVNNAIAELNGKTAKIHAEKIIITADSTNVTDVINAIYSQMAVSDYATGCRVNVIVNEKLWWSGLVWTNGGSNGRIWGLLLNFTSTSAYIFNKVNSSTAPTIKEL